MLADVSGGGTHHWAQMGWQRRRYSGYYTRWKWAQWTNDQGEWLDDRLDPEPLGQFTAYKVARDPVDIGTWDLRFVAQGTTLWTHRVHWLPDGVQWFGEINTMASQMPGDVSNHVGFKSALWRLGSDPWMAPDTFAIGNTTNFGASKYAPDWYVIWDKACP